ncbi:MAG: PDZ domain-containing protein [Pseudomonadota bacterium]
MKRIITDLLDDGRVQRRNSGMTLAGPSGRFRGVPGRRLAPRIVGVSTGSAAEAAGLSIGDAVLEADGRRMQTPADLYAAMDLARARGTLKMRVIRGATELETTLTLGEPAKPRD